MGHCAARVGLALSAGALLAVAAGCGDDRDRILASEKLYSQHDEELLIRHFFADRTGGFFLDVGAFHWKNQSTTYYLEKHLGWSGIAIDAQARFGPGYAKNRPGTRFFAYLVTDHSGTQDPFFLAGPLSSAKDSHLGEMAQAFGAEGAVAGREPREIQVPTITLDDLLDREGVETIDFLSMDIEQAEPQALAGFDIERFRPELVCIEAVPQVREQLLAYFAEHGYVRIERYLARDPANWYFTPAD